MANHEDDYHDDSLDHEGLENGISDDEQVEDIELIEDGPPDPPAPSGEYIFGQAEEPAVEATTTAEFAEPPARSTEDEQFLSEIEKAQRKSTGVGALILTVLISGVAFVAVGVAWWSWELTLMFVPILLIHELGHFVTMKSFKYRNVNMFFIPFLGAAVTGQQFNVPAWKKAVVALMGPLPSIFLATGVGIAAILLQLDWLINVCLVSLFLNGLNLVPLLPFDGGHVLQAVLFCRHYYLDVLLRVITIVIVIAVTVMLGGSTFLICLALFLLLTIQVTIRHGKIAAQLRSEGNLELVTEDDRVAPVTALRIAKELRARIKAKMSNKTLAQFTLQVVEQINTRPPGVLASIGLLFIHGAGLTIALLAGIGLSLAGNEALREQFLVGLQPPPLYLYDCDAVETRGEEYMPTYGTKLVLATFATPTEANAAYFAAKPDLSSKDQLQRFGRLVSIALDRDAEPKTLQFWIDRWEGDAQEVLVHASYPQVLFSLDATFPDEALALGVENELRAYFENAYQYTLNAPWQPDALVREPGEAEQYKARTSLLAVVKAIQEAVGDGEQTAAAERIGDFDEVTKINYEINRQAVAELKASNPDLDTVTVDLYLKVITGEYDDETRRQLMERMGGRFVAYEVENEESEEVETVDEDEPGSAKIDDETSEDRKPEDKDGDGAAEAASETEDGDDDDDYYSLSGSSERYAGRGSIMRNLQTVSLRAVHLNVTVEGAKAIADWLCSLGAYDVTYAFYIPE